MKNKQIEEEKGLDKDNNQQNDQIEELEEVDDDLVDFKVAKTKDEDHQKE